MLTQPALSLEAVYDRDGGICGICLRHVDENDAARDHIIPPSRGGGHEANNLQLAHRVCNVVKGNRLPEDVILSGPRVHVHLTEDLDLDVRLVAEMEEISRADVIRHAIRSYLEQKGSV